jgi:hypothetical protein
MRDDRYQKLPLCADLCSYPPPHSQRATTQKAYEIDHAAFCSKGCATGWKTRVFEHERSVKKQGSAGKQAYHVHDPKPFFTIFQ